METKSAIPIPKSATGPRPEFLTVKDVSEILGYSQKQVRRLMDVSREHRIPALKPGRRWLVPKVLFDQWIMREAYGDAS